MFVLYSVDRKVSAIPEHILFRNERIQSQQNNSRENFRNPYSDAHLNLKGNRALHNLGQWVKRAKQWGGE